MKALHFNFYGCEIVVQGDEAEVLEEIRRDYAYFHNRADAVRERREITLHNAPPDYATLPAIPAAFFTPRSVCYHDGTRSYVDYFGQGLVIIERKANRCDIYATDFDRLREIAYYYILSTVGETLDSQGLHRVHALGVAHKGQGVLLLLPSGGGKSTLALQLLQRPDFTLLAEDTPLVDRNGDLLAFPLRLGVRPEQPVDIPEAYLRTLDRMEFDPKKLIDIAYFQNKLCDKAPPLLLLVGQRNLGDISEIRPLSRPKAFRALLKYMIVGLGIYQGLEFLLERGTGELWGKGGLALSRTRNALRLLRRSSPHLFVLGRDRERNAQTLIEFLEQT